MHGKNNRQLTRLVSSTLAALAGAVLVVPLARCQQREHPRQAIFAAIQGETRVHWSTGETKPAEFGGVMRETESLHTGNTGQLIAVFPGTALVKIQPGTGIHIETLSSDETKLQISTGKIFVKAARLSPREILRVKTPHAILSVRGAEFGVACGGRQCSVAVTQGYVLVSKDGAETVLEAGRAADIAGKTIPRSATKREALDLERLRGVEIPPQVSDPMSVDLSAIETASAEAEALADFRISQLEKATQPRLLLRNPATKLTLENIRKKYGQVMKVYLKNGTSYVGFLRKKGSKIEIITARGVTRFPGSQLDRAEDIESGLDDGE